MSDDRKAAWARAKEFGTQLNELWPAGEWECEPKIEPGQFIAKATKSFTLKFQDMPKMAEIFGTEHLDFGHDEGEPSKRWSSVTYESGTPGSFVVIARVEA